MGVDHQWFVNRQEYYYSEHRDRLRVEVVRGWDYAGSNMLSSRWSRFGETESFDDPRKAVHAAIRVRLCWLMHRRRINKWDTDITIGVYGNGMGFELTGNTPEEALAWAEKQWEQQDKCDRCGEVLALGRGKRYTNSAMDDSSYCSEFCASEAYDETLPHCALDGCANRVYDNEYIGSEGSSYCSDECLELAEPAPEDDDARSE